MIYIASPFSAYGKEGAKLEYERYLKALKYQTMLRNSNIKCISPIALFYWLGKNNNLSTEADYWQEIDEYLLMQSDVMHVLCLPGWKSSKGVSSEIELAKKQNIEVIEIHGDFYE